MTSGPRLYHIRLYTPRSAEVRDSRRTTVLDFTPGEALLETETLLNALLNDLASADASMLGTTPAGYYLAVDDAETGQTLRWHARPSSH